MKPLPSTSPNTKYVPGRSIAEISEQYNIPADEIIKLDRTKTRSDPRLPRSEP